MKSFIFENANSSVNVEYVTDLIHNDAQNFTVMAIKGLDASEVALGFDFKHLPNTVNAFKKFAHDNNFKLTELEFQGAHSSSVLFNILVAGTISPAALTITSGTSPGQISGTAATGGTGTYAYQWQVSTNNSTWTDISGATSQNYTPGNLTATTYYRRKVTSGAVVYSNVSTITV